jgi:2',3'-cyclic-nucleotide 2'-phosphodiesterase (5'-nucleotidase family)
VEDLLEKYDDIISPANKVIGFNKSYKNSYYLCQLMADLYYDMGVEEWGDEYDIVLGGGYLSTRSPYNLSAGDVTYADVQSLFPFDNQLLLCSIKGVYLKSRFFATGNDDYYICYDEYGSYVKQNLNPSATYYVVVDSYTAYYAPNHLTVVEEYDPNIFPRDLLAQHIKDGGLS